MIRLKLDENLGATAAAQLRRAGYDVATAFEQGLASATDTRLISACRAEARCLVTLDLDFANPLRFDPTTSPGIAVLRLSRRPVRDALEEGLDTLIRGLGRMSVDGRLWVVHGSRIRTFAGSE